ncbi:MAG: DUF1501 domain-containing protein [Planctomycetes bacterium]|nr:DUF1501 domain-containing protein [Planctomycetota bacterium]
MLTIQDRPARLCDGMTRRDWLRVGGLGAFGLSLPSLLQTRQAEAAAIDSSFGKAKSCIVVFLLGGPPQHETWDPKPEAPAEVRGEFKPIPSATPGFHVGELMPHAARLTEHIAVLRAMYTNDSAHSSSGYWMLTGHPHQPTNSENARPGAPNDSPCVGAVVNWLRQQHVQALPAAIRLPEEIWNTGHLLWPGQDGGFLGRKADPWLLTCDPNAADFEVPGLGLPSDLPPLRVDRRRSLLDGVNRHLDAADRGGTVTNWDSISQQAFDLLRSSKGRRAFNLDDEPPSVRDRYGRNRFGQSMLLARRLIEAGVSLVQVNWTRWETDTADAPAWDTHSKNAERLKTALMPPMDQGYSALIEDLAAHGRLDETLIVWMGEFGRTPKINARGGRDHWGYVFPVALAGGGIRGGVVHGASDSIGGYPKDGRVQPQDMTATIFHLLGHAAHTEIRDPLGRPLVISKGEVIRQVL